MRSSPAGRISRTRRASAALIAAVLWVAPAAAGQTVRVGPGDTLGGIAARHGVSVSSLMRANRSRYPGIRADYVQTGWTLRLPGAGGETRGGGGGGRSSGRAREVRVRSGQTLSGLARSHGVAQRGIVEANRSRYPGIARGELQAGWRLRIPGAPDPARAGWRRLREYPHGRDGVRILFRPGADRPVRAHVADLVERCLREAGVRTVEISATTNGRHRRGSYHYEGRSVDICEIDGIPVRDLGPDARVRAIQRAFRRHRPPENYGPALIEQRNRPWRPGNYAGVRLQHCNHIHISF